MIAAVSRLTSEGFRIFFFSAALYGLFVGVIWLLWVGAMALGTAMELPGLGHLPQQWHAHEMIFGYSLAAVGGFFLTAVPNWTNTPGARHGFVLAVAALWLVGRLALWFAGALDPVLVMVLDQLFVPVLAAKILAQLIKRPKPQNMVFLGFLSALWVANLLVHLEWVGLTGTLDSGLRMGLLALVGMIAVLGGRVTPAFTRNAMKREALDEATWPNSPEILNKVVMILALALPWSAVWMPLAGLVALLLAGAQAARQWNWFTPWMLRQPILWSLHLGMAFMALGLALWGAAQFGFGDELMALHLLGIGCVTGMTVAVMSRASLGHTGRALIAPRPVAIAYGLLAVSALMRGFGPGLWSAGYFQVMVLAALAWCLSFLLLIYALTPILSSPKQG